MSNGTKNLMLARSDKSVWDEPGLSEAWSACDQDRWLTAAAGSVMALTGARRGGFAGGLLATLGAGLTIRAAMGRHDLRAAREWLDRRLRDRGWLPQDTVGEASDESFPASDAPSWTPTAGARMER